MTMEEDGLELLVLLEKKRRQSMQGTKRVFYDTVLVFGNGFSNQIFRDTQ